MKMLNSHRIFSVSIAAWLFLMLVVTASAEDGHDHAPVTNFVEGKHFHRITPTVETDGCRRRQSRGAGIILVRLSTLL